MRMKMFQTEADLLTYRWALVGKPPRKYLETKLIPIAEKLAKNHG